MNKISGIYKIENLVNHKLYIGQSDDLYRREQAHFNELKGNRHYNRHLQASYNKYGADNFKFEIVEECNINLLDEREIYWISYFNSFKCGYNQNLGGGSNRGWIPSEETRLKMSLNHADFSGKNNCMYGKSLYDVLTEDEVKKWKHNSSIANSGKNNGFYGKRHTDETKAKISQSRTGKCKGKDSPNYGKHISKKQMNKMRQGYIDKYHDNSPLSVPVICLNTMEIFNSISKAAKFYNISSTTIVECGNGNNYTAGTINGIGLVWMHYNDYLKNKDKIDIDKIITDTNDRRMHKGKFSYASKQVICLNTKQIFDSATDAGNKLHIDNSGIGKCCKGKLKFAGKDTITNENLVWMFYDDYVANQAKAC